MREQLKEINNVRATFSGTVVRFGTKPAFKGAPIKTVLLRDVKDKDDQVMTDHLWFVVGIQFENLKLIPGDVICFDARVSIYRKGYRGRRRDDDDGYYDDRPPPSTDYRLSRPTKVRKISSGPAPPISAEPERTLVDIADLIRIAVSGPLPEAAKPLARLRMRCHCSGWPGPTTESGHSLYCRKRNESQEGISSERLAKTNP